MENPQCPLSPWKMEAMKWNVSDLMKIERHVSNQTTDCPHPQLKDLDLTGSLQDSTPLLMACHVGNLASVKRIIEKWGVDANATGVYYHSSRGFREYCSYGYSAKVWYVNDASPIFVAARTGHSDIVRYLLEKGADATVKTLSERDISFHYGPGEVHEGDTAGLTTLHAVVSCDSPTAEKIEILRLLLDAGADPSALTSDGYPIWKMKFCGLDAITILLEHSPNCFTQVRPINSETVLHRWASTYLCCEPINSLAVVELLLAKGADLQARDSQGFTPILSSILGNGRNGPNFPVLNHLLERGDVARLDKINAMEMAGAILLMNNNIRPNPENVILAFGYWRRASQLRQMETDGCVPIPKELLVLNKARPASSVVEWSSPSQLEELVNQPSEHTIQSLLVLLRIYFRISWEAVYGVFPDISNHLTSGWFSSKIEDDIQTLWVILEAYLLYFDSYRLDQKLPRRFDLISKLVDFSSKYFENRLLLDCEPFLETSLRLIVATLDQRSHFPPLWLFNVYQRAEIDDYLEVFLKFVSILAKLSQKSIDRLMPSIRKLLVLIHQEGGPNKKLLLLACKSYRNHRGMWKPIRPNALATVRLLLQAGANPDIVDSRGNSPRHRLANTGFQVVHPIGALLLNAGAYLDRTNNQGKTTAQLWMEERNPPQEFIDDDEEEEESNEDDSLPDWCRSEGVPTLFRLSGRVIRTHQIPFRKLPEALINFITSLKK